MIQLHIEKLVARYNYAPNTYADFSEINSQDMELIDMSLPLVCINYVSSMCKLATLPNL